MKKRTISLLLALAMCLALPAAASSAGAPLTVKEGLILSDYIITDQYESMAEYGEDWTYSYYLGEIPFGDGLNCFLLPLDATVTFLDSEYSISAMTLDELDTSSEEWAWMGLAGTDTKLYAEGDAGYKEYDQASGGAEWDLARFQAEFPGFGYLRCGINDWSIPIMFVDPDTLFAPNDSEPATSTPAPADPEPDTVGGFTDVKKGDYFADSVLWAVDKGVTTGTGDGTTFSPDTTCSVSEILTFLWRAKGSPAPAITDPYTAGSAEGWFKDAALWAYENDLTADGPFPAGDPCTRSMVAVYLWKLAGSPAASGSQFTDVSENAHYAQAVAWAVSQGITTGTGDGSTFSPDKTCTRAEIVTFLYRALA